MREKKASCRQQVERKGALGEEERDERRSPGIKELRHTSGPCQLNNVKEDLSLIWMEVITLIPGKAIQAESQAEECYTK